MTKESDKDRPKKPLNYYFQFRMEKMAKYKGLPDAKDKLKADWENVPEAVKEA